MEKERNSETNKGTYGDCEPKRNAVEQQKEGEETGTDKKLINQTAGRSIQTVHPSKSLVQILELLISAGRSHRSIELVFLFLPFLELLKKHRPNPAQHWQ